MLFISIPIISIVLFPVGLVCIYFGYIQLKKKHLVDNIPTSKIRSIAMGLVEICGVVVPFSKMNVLKSPFTKKDCVYYKYTIEEYQSHGKNSSWVTIKKGIDCMKFYLKDETGRVIIDPRGADVRISLDNEFNSSLGKDPPELVKQFLEKSDVDFEGLIFKINKTMRYREYFIKPDDKLYIMGTAGDNPSVDDASVSEGVKDIMIKKGKHEKFFLISDKPEKKVSLDFFAMSMFLFVVGGVMLILSLIMLLIMVM